MNIGDFRYDDERFQVEVKLSKIDELDIQLNLDNPILYESGKNYNFYFHKICEYKCRKCHKCNGINYAIEFKK